MLGYGYKRKYFRRLCASLPSFLHRKMWIKHEQIYPRRRMIPTQINLCVYIIFQRSIHQIYIKLYGKKNEYTSGDISKYVDWRLGFEYTQKIYIFLNRNRVNVYLTIREIGCDYRASKWHTLSIFESFTYCLYKHNILFILSLKFK